MSAEATTRKARGRLTGPVRVHLQRIRSMAISGAAGSVLASELAELDNEIVGVAALLEPRPVPRPTPRCTCMSKTYRSAPPCPIHDSLPGVGPA